ncbi:hypothetical protein IQ07DRAFT_660627 [Pyrenochaeta sp. DS3sAY3a]|nr:hypothetical protein IQ07DRAFT_660627 [Pyrenochaeta sp. DS3sAY3a]
MSETDQVLSSALELIMQNASSWLGKDGNPEYGDLANILQALELLKHVAQQKLQKLRLASDMRVLRSGALRSNPSSGGTIARRRVSNHATLRTHTVHTTPANSPELFVAEDEVDNEAWNEHWHLQDSETETYPSRQVAVSNEAHSDELSTAGIEASPSLDAAEGQDITSSNQPELPFISELSDALEDATMQAAILPQRTQDLAASDSSAQFEGSVQEQTERDTLTGLNDTSIHQFRPDSPQSATQLDEMDTTCYFDEAFHAEHYGSRSNSLASSNVENSRVDDNLPDPIFQPYLDLASRSHFSLPHTNQIQTGSSSVQELEPLATGAPLSIALIHSLLHTLIPGPLRIIELPLNYENSVLETLDGNFIIMLHLQAGAVPVLIVGHFQIRSLFVLGSSNLADIERLGATFLDWRKVHINLRTIDPDMEATLLLVYLAEVCFQNKLPISRTPSARQLRIRYLDELMSPYQRDYVLSHHGITNNIAPSQKSDTRIVSSGVPGSGEDILLPDLEKFDMDSLRRVYREMPSDIKLKRSLRILQCVNEIGSPHILQSIQAGLSQKPTGDIDHGVERPMVEKLFQIHLLLEKQEGQSHLKVAKNRYIKYCYFETYSLAVKALQEVKRSSNQEQHMVSAFKLTESFKQGCYNEFPPTPYTDAIHNNYKELSDIEKKRRAQDMVKDEVTYKILHISKRKKDDIKKSITRYIREGKVLHYILQGNACLNPGIFILFPGVESEAPSLDLTQLVCELSENEKRSLGRPIGVKDVDSLTQSEAQWFGKILQTRPDLLDHVPRTILGIISNTTEDSIDVQERSVEDYKHRPLQFFNP